MKSVVALKNWKHFSFFFCFFFFFFFKHSHGCNTFVLRIFLLDSRKEKKKENCKLSVALQNIKPTSEVKVNDKEQKANKPDE